MTDGDWVQITGAASDPLIGDSEILSIHFRPDGGGLLLELENGFPDGYRVSELRFRGVEFFQLANDALHYLGGIEIFDRVSDALSHPEVGLYLRSAFPNSPAWLPRLSELPGLKVYRLMPIAGAETFVVCSEAAMRPWRPKPE